MKRVWVVAAIGLLLLAASLSVLLGTLLPADVEAVNGGFNLVATPTPTPTPTPMPTPTPTPTLIPTPTTPGGGGGSSQPSISEPFIIDLLGVETDWRISSEGKVLQDISVVSEDGCITLEIARGTLALDAEGQPLDSITVNRLSVHPDPPPGYGIVCAVEFEPDGATFNPALTLIVAVTPEMLSGLDGSTMVAAYFNDETGEWELIGGEYDAATQVFTFSISHFTTFILLAQPGASPTPDVTPVPAEKGTSGIWLIALLVVIGLALLSLFFFVVLRRRRKKQLKKKQPEKKSDKDDSW
jgi:hypothetical protein